jgi:hypothetical protein
MLTAVRPARWPYPGYAPWWQRALEPDVLLGRRGVLGKGPSRLDQGLILATPVPREPLATSLARWVVDVDDSISSLFTGDHWQDPWTYVVIAGSAAAVAAGGWLVLAKAGLMTTAVGLGMAVGGVTSGLQVMSGVDPGQAAWGGAKAFGATTAAVLTAGATAKFMAPMAGGAAGTVLSGGMAFGTDPAQMSFHHITCVARLPLFPSRRHIGRRKPPCP